jgi:hypothetical protein
VRGCSEVSGGSRGAVESQGWTKSSPKSSMGNIGYPASKVFDEMPERNKFLNFANIFGGL